MSLLCKPGLSTAALLDEAENELSGHGLRCVRVYGPASGGLTLRDLVGQIVARADPDALTDGDLKAGFATLTEPGEGHGRVALLVTEAHNLLPAAMRYIQLACRSSPKLRVVLAGQPGLAEILAQDEFAFLRQRIARTLKLPGPMRGKLSRPWSVLAGLCRGGARPLARLGAVAASVLLIAALGWHHGPASSEAAVHAGNAGSAAQDAPPRAAPAAPADAPSPAEPAAAQKDDAAAGRQAQEAFPPEPGPANVSLAETGDAPAGRGPVPAETPAVPAEDGARDASSASAQSPNSAEPAPDAALPAPALAAAPMPAPQPRSSPAAAPFPLDASQARRLRGGTERAAATSPTHFADERRCRDIVLRTQSGKDLSDGDQLFLRNGCRAN